ncbi:Zinc finger protein [Sarracenia purpurea var. burkii]
MRLRANEGKGNPARQVFDVLNDPRSVVLQPAFVRCLGERISLCQTCDSLEHTGRASTSTRQEAVNCYSGCPSAVELSTIRPLVLDFPSVGDFTCAQEMNSMNITERIPTNGGDPIQGNNGQDASVSVEINQWNWQTQLHPKCAVPEQKYQILVKMISTRNLIWMKLT